MLKSMTAYGRAVNSSSLGRFVCEIQSLNRKFLEVHVHLPPELTSFDTEIRKWVSNKVNRGKVSIKIVAFFDEKIPLSVRPNIQLARQVKSACEEIATELNLESNNAFTLQMLGHEPGLLCHQEAFEDEETFRSLLREVTSEALDSLVGMKVEEGRAIYLDFKERCSSLESWIAEVEKHAQGAVEQYREKIRNRIEEALPGSADNDDRILREICLFAEKVDISEEITRFRSHLKQFEALANSTREGVGKTLEFLLQELHRETNTIGSKSVDIETSKRVVEMKTELEKIREQVQNVE